MHGHSSLRTESTTTLVRARRMWLCCLALFGLSANVLLDAKLTWGQVPNVEESAGQVSGAEGIDFFESHVRPLLAEHCWSCHGPDKQESGLRLDGRQFLLAGGSSGPAITEPANESLLLKAVNHEEGLEMPPAGPLGDSQIRNLEHWLALGAPWPDDDTPLKATDDRQDHWAFMPRKIIMPPAVEDPDGWIKSPVDNFVLPRLQAAGLTPSPEADRSTLARRVYQYVTGLPPTHDQLQSFVENENDNAYEELVDQLLNSPHYGEHLARMWMDIARYSDTKGYVYGREERFWVHAWAYRDWLIRSFNEDMPYDRFLALQIAGDQIADRRVEDAAAMGFLTLGRRFLGIKHDIIDDRIDVLCRGTMGLTVACARCHDHKYDPIPTADYYSLYGVFDSSAEKYQIATDDPASLVGEVAFNAFQSELEKREQAYRDKLNNYRFAASERVRGRIADYLKSQTELEKYPVEGFDQVLYAEDVIPAFVRRWRTYLRRMELEQDPIWIAWHRFKEIESENFAEEAEEVCAALTKESLHPAVRELFARAPASFDEVIQRYAGLFNEINRRWKETKDVSVAGGSETPQPMEDPQDETLRAVLYSPESPCEIPSEGIVHTEYYFPTSQCVELWQARGEVDRWIINSPSAVPYSVTLVDRDVPSQPRIFRRGSAKQPAKEVPRQFLAVIAGEDRVPFSIGSGRWELAQAIIDPNNPLTARVIVNRVWARLIGEGLVTTPSDFGTRASEPSHPELLDWLAQQLIDSGWSLKRLHREILLSATFRQASTGPSDVAIKQMAIRIDPGNRLLWRMNSHRLTFEEIRDAMLVSTGDLSPEIGGKPVNLLAEPFPKRRAVYGLVDRQFLPGLLRTFDFANPDLHTPVRNETTVPQQALFFMNHPFVLERARVLAEQVAEMSNGEAIRSIFLAVLQREPTPVEFEEALAWKSLAESTAVVPPPATVADWSYGFGEVDEAAGQTENFTPLPFFNGSAWQGGAAWPDGALGWVQLTATGGHPGNDRAHAAVRRWTAPQTGTYKIASELKHEAAPGDGIRAFVVSSRQGVLDQQHAHQRTVSMGVEQLELEAGDTIDFVVDIGDVLNSDQFLWQASITRALADASDGPSVWMSREDFTQDMVTPLGPWEQFAQVLLCGNEFCFVD